MTKQYQIQEYVNKNVWKGKNEIGVIVWHAFDAREGDTFQSETYQEAVKNFVGNWDNLTEQEKNNC
jgi:hypothetical protein